MKCAFYTLGCKVNHYESNAMAQSMEKYGFTCVDPHEEADVYVINSCTVTAESDRKTRQAVRKFKKNHPDSIVVLTGCMTQASPDTAALLPQADIVIGNRNNPGLFAYVMQYINRRERITDILPHESGEKFSGDAVTDYADRTRAIVKIEDGCDRFCSYCIIPYARGRVRSKPLDEMVKEITALAQNGFREVVLVGINLSAYGRDIGTGLTSAVKAAAGVEGIERVRLGSLEPDHITRDVIKELSEIPEFCPQFHISLQSGCDKTLKKMNRHYSSVEYEDLCHCLRSTFPDCTITTDVMVGFPGESQSDFDISLDFVKKTRFEKVHVFPYSRRPGTPAARLDNQISNQEKQRRAEIMIDETEKIRREFLASQTGRIYEIIPEENRPDGVKGYTANYIPVIIEGGSAGSGTPVKVKITGVKGDCCTGEPV
jgi:threonylcarbamoyladenosine tRNA methylthiotransferase MtaB